MGWKAIKVDKDNNIGCWKLKFSLVSKYRWEAKNDFVEEDDGLFYMKPDDWKRKKYDLFTKETKTVEKMMKKLIDNLKEKNYCEKSLQQR